MTVLLLAFSAAFRTAASPAADSLLVVFWNVENFFDYRSDSEYKPEYWTRRRFEAKCEAICKTLLSVADRYGRIPDIVALAEVEKPSVTQSLVRSTLLRKLGYSIVHYDSPDHRGIDCALLYRNGTLPSCLPSARHLLGDDLAPVATRDFLVARFGRFCVVVNHHPSKVGGGKSELRSSAMRQMLCVKDSLMLAGCSGVLCLGDFNDTLWEPAGPREGTIKYNGHWEKIDGCFTFGDICVTQEAFADASLLTEDRVFGGLRPRRCFSGPRYEGGVSDHLPLVMIVKFD